MTINEKKDNNRTLAETSCGDTLPPLEKYDISNKSLLLISGLLFVVAGLLFNIECFLNWITIDGFIRLCEILANYYLILVGGILALWTMRKLKRESLKCIKRWETVWATLFVVIITIISIAGAYWDGEIWRNVQFFGYALSAFLVSCWLGTDDRKPTIEQPNIPDAEDDQEPEGNQDTEKTSE